MTDVRTFRAATIHDALHHIRLEMGRDAVVLQTREIESRRFLRRRREVEVTAGLAMKTAATDDLPASATGQSPAFSAPQQMSALLDRRLLVPRSDAGIDLSQEGPPHAATTGDRPRTSEQTNPRDRSLLAERLETIESLLAQFSQRVADAKIDSIPPQLFHQYTRLIEADVPEGHARALVIELQRQIEPDGATSADSSEEALAALIESQIRCSGPIAVEPGQPRVVALVGPTGVGKTTTIAKLAANFRLRDGVKLGLVTVDTYRVAAVEQLRTYADIIDLPMQVVTSSLEMRRAIDTLADMDLILIDTAGRSPREELQLQELKALLTEAHVDEVHLVLSLATNPRVLQMTAEKFAGVGVTSLILTKLDEAAGMGTLVSVARGINHPISYLTTGQDVPDDIEAASAARATRLILGKDDLFPHRYGLRTSPPPSG